MRSGRSGWGLVLLRLPVQRLQQPSRYGVGPCFRSRSRQGSEQGRHRRSFVDEAANVAFGFSQAHGLCEHADGVLFFPPHLLGQGLQDQHLDDMAFPSACSSPLQVSGSEGLAPLAVFPGPA